MTTANNNISLSNPALLEEETNVVIHPLVLLSVLDHHTRRQEAEGRVIGTLLGRRDGNKVEVTNCFAVPHAERGDEVAIGKDFNKQMLALHMKSNRKEVVVGWYASACSAMPLVADTSSLIHDFYATEADDGDPVHLVVDTRLLQDSLQIRAYTSSPVTIQGEPLANLFHEIKVQLHSSEAEAICLNEMLKSQKTSAEESPADSTAGESSESLLQVSMKKLLALIVTASTYVDEVVDGRRPADPVVGRQIADTLATVPRIRPQVFDKVFHDSLQDLLMVTYLSNITRTQLTIAEKLNASLGI